MKTLSHHTVSSLETGTVFQSFVLYSEWQASGVVGLDRISLAKLGLHVPEFHFLHSSRLAWAMGDILHDICKAEVNQQLYSLYTGRSAQGTRHCGTSHRLARLTCWHRAAGEPVVPTGFLPSAPAAPGLHGGGQPLPLWTPPWSHWKLKGCERWTWASFHPGGFRLIFAGSHLLSSFTSRPPVLPAACLAASGCSTRGVTHYIRSNSIISHIYTHINT